MRGQANLPALAVALLVVTTTAGVSVALADAAFQGADRDATARATADATAERIVAADSPVAERRNVLAERRLERAALEAVVPDGVDVRVVLAGAVRYERGDPTGGPTVRRLVLVAERQSVTVTPPLRYNEVTLPRRSPNATISISEGAQVETVRANDRVVLHDPDGVVGDHEVELSRYETTTLEFDGDPDEGDVEVTYHPRRTTKAHLEVTVGE